MITDSMRDEMRIWINVVASGDYDRKIFANKAKLALEEFDKGNLEPSIQIFRHLERQSEYVEVERFRFKMWIREIKALYRRSKRRVKEEI